MIDWTMHDKIVELRLEQPPCNELGSYALERLEQFLDDPILDKAGAVIIYSTLSGFSAGANLRELHEALPKYSHDEGRSRLRLIIDRMHQCMNRLDALPIPVIAAVNGICFGGGFELALACDLIVAEKNARFCLPELRLGLLPGFGGIPRLERTVGTGPILDLLLTGRGIGAAKAMELGIVSQVVAPGEALEVARDVAKQTLAYDSFALSRVKAFAKKIPYERLEAEKELFIELAMRPALKESLKDFVSRNDPYPYLPKKQP